MDSFEHALRERLLERTRGEIATLNDALARGERGEIRRLAHRLHGAAGALELKRLSELGAALEAACASADDRTLAATIAELAAEVAPPGATTGSRA